MVTKVVSEGHGRGVSKLFNRLLQVWAISLMEGVYWKHCTCWTHLTSSLGNVCRAWLSGCVSCGRVPSLTSPTTLTSQRTTSYRWVHGGVYWHSFVSVCRWLWLWPWVDWGSRPLHSGLLSLVRPPLLLYWPSPLSLHRWAPLRNGGLYRTLKHTNWRECVS